MAALSWSRAACVTDWASPADLVGVARLAPLEESPFGGDDRDAPVNLELGAPADDEGAVELRDAPDGAAPLGSA